MAALMWTEYTVYTNGACSYNGLAGATAGIGVYWGPNHHLNVSERLPGRQTNNRAEIYAAVNAVQQARQNNINTIVIKTHSKFLVDSMNLWVHNWQQNGWTKVTGDEVVNKEDFQALLQAREGVNVRFEYVPKDARIEGNDCADRLAREGKSL